MKVKNNLAKAVGIGLSFLLTFLPIKGEEAKIIDGWVESTAGIEQGPNLRLYPRVNVEGTKLESLIDINDFYAFSKTDISHDKLEVKLGDNFILKPVATFHTNSYEKQITGDVNITASTNNYFGFFEVDVNPKNLKQPNFLLIII